MLHWILSGMPEGWAFSHSACHLQLRKVCVSLCEGEPFFRILSLMDVLVEAEAVEMQLFLNQSTSSSAVQGVRLSVEIDMKEACFCMCQTALHVKSTCFRENWRTAGHCQKVSEYVPIFSVYIYIYTVSFGIFLSQAQMFFAFLI